MFIRFISGEISKAAHVPVGLFCAVEQLEEFGGVPQHDLDALVELEGWFDVHLKSPFDCLPRLTRYDRAVCWFKATANEHLGRAWELATILERNDLFIWTIKSTRTGYVYYEDDAQVFAEPYADDRRLLRR